MAKRSPNGALFLWPAWGRKRFGLCGPLPAKCFSSPDLKRESASPLKDGWEGALQPGKPRPEGSASSWRKEGREKRFGSEELFPAKRFRLAAGMKRFVLRKKRERFGSRSWEIRKRFLLGEREKRFVGNSPGPRGSASAFGGISSEALRSKKKRGEVLRF